ncbi:MAG: hypothetical protein A2452_10955 [Candidatus Firestonebacteria bacterium RIFOXYC2_FULL_39_67]|nr:MAG: hypothetical protein A2536_08855 [Candidatus Firestonebacteria bacterium RIFOXYD2_FULL_39_29]OGF55973.1 MAG: hypothetical protein A2452_10955 [Candidatus Firestonebacteria bacterium RIFOXYC2_FULL_39_67]OGF57807.1 MAG: hypothetical protein A2497_01440 [Candidatus Firestonebacteria bacterium RifOxyC12_full_39_7]
MITIKADTTLVGVSELRNNIDKIIKATRYNNVILEKRHKPVLAIMSMVKYEKLQELIEELEDRELGYVAQKRMQKTKLSEYISLDEAEKRVGLKK